jgi:hypothetical protein
MSKAISLRSRVAGAGLLLLAGLAPGAAEAATFSFVGNISRDDEVQLFNFTIGTSSNVILKTLSWAGGTNADGVTIAAGGFDPILAVFSADGTKIGFNDDGTSSQVPQNSGQHFDTYLELGGLAAGSYTVAVSQYNNFAGATLTSPFSQQGGGEFTGAEFECVTQVSLCAIGALPRDSHWAFDILGVETASNPTGGNGNGGTDNSAVPIPAAFFLFGGALAGVGGLSRMKRKKA